MNRLLLLVPVAVLVVAHPTSAQEGALPVSDDEFLAEIMTLYEGGRVSEGFMSQVEGLVREKLEWEREKIRLSREVIARTNRTAMVGTLIVHTAVVMGFLAALAEFFHAWRLRRDGTKESEHEVRIGLEGVAVKTSFYGLLILVTAAGFYLMYVRFVYPIQVIGS